MAGCPGTDCPVEAGSWVWAQRTGSTMTAWAGGGPAARPLCLPRRALPAGGGVPKGSAKGRQCGLGSEANKGHTPVQVGEAVSCYVIMLPIGSGQPMHTLLRRNGIPISHRAWKWVLQGLCVPRLQRKSLWKVAQRQGGLWLLAQLLCSGRRQSELQGKERVQGPWQASATL